MARILIVEDDFDIAELLENWLAEAGHQTEAFANSAKIQTCVLYCHR